MRVLTQQKAYHPFVRRTTAPERIRKLRRLREVLKSRREELQAALRADLGKPEAEAELTDVLPVLLEIRSAVNNLRDWMAPTKVKAPVSLIGTVSEIRYEPRGVALIIAPWNYPVTLSLGPLVSAVAAGCCAVIKPSEYTPRASRFVKELVSDVFDEREVTVVEGDARIAQALLALPFDHIFFTGSPKVGKLVMAAAAEYLASVTLELGGKSPAIVDETADLEAAAERIVVGKYLNAGQTCIAPDHVLVHERIHNDLVIRLRNQIEYRFGPDPAHSGSFARIVSESHTERLRDLLKEAVDAGAQVAAGGIADLAARYVAPTLLTNVPSGARIMEEEIFGPILPVIPFPMLDAAITSVNSRPKPLVLYIFSKDERALERVLRETSAGGTCINDTVVQFAHPNLPFGGVGTSGFGKAHGHTGFLAFSNQRSVLRQRLKAPPTRKLYPPFTAATNALLNQLLRVL